MWPGASAGAVDRGLGLGYMCRAVLLLGFLAWCWTIAGSAGSIDYVGNCRTCLCRASPSLYPHRAAAQSGQCCLPHVQGMLCVRPWSSSWDIPGLHQFIERESGGSFLYHCKWVACLKLSQINKQTNGLNK